MTGTRAAIIGVGNEYRGDDALGLRVARRLQEQVLEGNAERPREGRLGNEAPKPVRVVAWQSDLMGLLDAWTALDTVVLVDALATGAAPGTVHRLDVSKAPLGHRGPATSTHGIGLVQVIELGRALGRLPRRLVIVGVEGRDFQEAAPLSPEVAGAVDDVVKVALEEAR